MVYVYNALSGDCNGKYTKILRHSEIIAPITAVQRIRADIFGRSAPVHTVHLVHSVCAPWPWTGTFPSEIMAAHIDIADWLIRCHNVTTCHSERSPEGGVEESPAKKSRAFLLAARYLSPEN